MIRILGGKIVSTVTLYFQLMIEREEQDREYYKHEMHCFFCISINKKQREIVDFSPLGMVPITTETKYNICRGSHEE